MTGPDRAPEVPPSSEDPASDPQVPLPVLGTATSHFTELERPPVTEPPVAPRAVERGVVAFDLDGTILDDIGAISTVAADVLHAAFGTPLEEGRIHYLATTGMPFEAQLAQLYPGVPAADRARVAREFHERKVREAYKAAHPFPEVPRLLRELGREGWTLVVSTGAEREMADLVLEREGLRFWFEAVLGSGQGTKREHLVEFRRRYPGARIFLVGDSRFDMEAAAASEGTVPLARASHLPGWSLTPADLERWGARWADYTLEGLPAALRKLEKAPSPKATPGRRRRSKAR